jgi:hypothetical protein
VEDTKKNMAQTQAKCVGMVNDDIVVKLLDTLKEKTAQTQMQPKEIMDKF